MLEALVAGEVDPAVLAQLAKGRLREKLPQLEQALAGTVGAHHRLLIARQLAHIDFLDEAIAPVSDEVAARLEAAEAAIERLDTIPGGGRRTAEVMVAEVGVDVSRFPTAGHLPACAPATTRAPADAALARRAREVHGCARPWSRRPKPRAGPSRPTWARRSGAAGAQEGGPSPSATRSSSSPPTWCSVGRTMRNSARTTSTTETVSASSVGWSDDSNAAATRSLWSPSQPSRG
jgi:hypothetical protein